MNAIDNAPATAEPITQEGITWRGSPAAYGIAASEIKQRSHELCACKETSLYPILNRLLEKDLVSTSNVVTEKKKIRVYYHLSKTGKEYYEDMKKNYAAYITTVNNFLKLEV